MPSTFTGSGIELIADGEQSGVWGQTTNDNLQIINRLVSEAGSIALSGTTHTLTIADGSLSDGQYGVLVFGGSPSGTNTVTVSPNDAKRIFIVKNGTSESVVLTQGSGGNVTIPASAFKIVYTDGGGAGAAVVDVTSVVDINGGTIDGVTIGGASAGAGTFTTVNATTGNITTVNATTVDSTNVEVTNIKAKDGTASATIADSTGVMTIASSVLTTADINGGAIDGTVIGGSTPAAISGTTGTFSGNLTVDTDTLFVDAANNLVGIGTTSPNASLEVADGAANGLVRIGQLQFKNSSGSYINSTDGVFIFPFTDSMFYHDNYDGGFIWRPLGVESMRITSTGLVGIGTTSPVATLEVNAPTTNGVVRLGALQFKNSSGSYSGGADGINIFPFTDGVLYHDNYDGGFAWRTNTSATERMRVNDTGLGIGTTPAVALHVSGAGVPFYLDSTNSNAYKLAFRDSTTIRGYIGASSVTEFTVASAAASERLRVDTAGNLLVNTTTALAKLGVEAGANSNGMRALASTGGYVGVYGEHSLNGGTGYVAYFYNTGAGNGQYIANGGSWLAISDERQKEDIKDLDATERLMQLRPVDYLWKHQAASEEPDRRNLGFIAQEVQQVFPELVSTSPDGMLGVEYTGLISPLVKALQEAMAEIADLKARVAALEA
jgi:hypothetical protein